MTQSRPEFHLQRVNDDGSSEQPEIFSLQNLPFEFQSSRRGFLGTGVTVAGMLSLISGCTQGVDNADKGKLIANEEADISSDEVKKKRAEKETSRREQMASHATSIYAHPKGSSHLGSPSLAMLEDGNTLVSGGSDGVKFWSLPDGELIRKYGGEQPRVYTIAISPDSKMFASSAENIYIKIWTVADQELQQKLDGHEKTVTSVAYSPDGTMLVSGSDDETIKLWSMPDGRQLKTIRGHQNRVVKVIFAINGTIVVSASEDKTIRLWSVSTGKQIGQPLQHEADFAVNAAGTTLVTAGPTTQIKVWSLPEMKLLSSLKHEQIVTKVAITPDGKTVIGAADNRKLMIFDLEDELSKKGKGRFFGLHGQPQTRNGVPVNITTMEISADGSRLVTTGSDGTTQVISLPDGTVLQIPRPVHSGKISPITALTISPNNKWMIYRQANRKFSLKSLIAGRSFSGWPEQSFPKRSLGGSRKAVTLDGKYEVRSFNHDRITISPRDGLVANGKETTKLPTKRGGFPIIVTPDGQLAISSVGDDKIKVISLPDGKKVSHLLGHEGAVRTVAVSPTEVMLASGGTDNTVKLWSLDDNSLLKTLTGHTGSIEAITFTPDGQTLLTGSDDHKISLWSMPSGELIQSLEGQTGPITKLVLSPDGTVLAAADRETGISLWSLQTRQHVKTLIHRAPIHSMKISPDGKHLAVGSFTGTAMIWSLPDGKLIHTIRHERDGSVNCLLFNSDGTKLITGSSHRTVKVWSLAGAELLKTMRHDNSITSMAITSDDRYLAVGAFDKTIRVYFNLGSAASYLYHRSPVSSLAITPDGKTLVAQGNNKSIMAWSPFSSSRPQTFYEPANPSLKPEELAKRSLQKNRTRRREFDNEATVFEIGIAPDGTYGASCGADELIRLWSVPNLMPVGILSGHENHILGIAFSPDGKWLASASSDKTVKLWSMPDGELVQTLTDHEYSVGHVIFSGDNRILASADSSGVIILWDMPCAKKRGYLFDPSASQTDAYTYKRRDPITGLMLTYTLPCGSPIHPNATCVCNCVPGTYRPPRRRSSGSSYGGICTCNQVCICIPVCQAHRLLDQDPVVRTMARQLLLMMGQRELEYMHWAADCAESQLRNRILSTIIQIQAGLQSDPSQWPTVADCVSRLNHEDAVTATMSAQVLTLLQINTDAQFSLTSQQQSLVEQLVDDARRRPWFVRYGVKFN